MIGVRRTAPLPRAPGTAGSRRGGAGPDTRRCACSVSATPLYQPVAGLLLNDWTEDVRGQHRPRSWVGAAGSRARGSLPRHPDSPLESRPGRSLGGLPPLPLPLPLPPRTRESPRLCPTGQGALHRPPSHRRSPGSASPQEASQALVRMRPAPLATRRPQMPGPLWELLCSPACPPGAVSGLLMEGDHPCPQAPRAFLTFVPQLGEDCFFPSAVCLCGQWGHMGRLALFAPRDEIN